MDNQPIFKYPWNNLEDYLRSTHQRELSLLAFGSLINAKSASKTISSDNPMNRTPIYATGVRRVFNYRMPESAYSRYGKPVSEKYVAALNVVTTKNSNDIVNGISQSIGFNNLESFREREVGYQLSPVHAFDWITREHIDLPIYALELTNPETNILPHLNYLEVCLEGALSISQQFQREFCDTTYLADINTKLIDWIDKR